MDTYQQRSPQLQNTNKPSHRGDAENIDTNSQTLELTEQPSSNDMRVVAHVVETLIDVIVQIEEYREEEEEEEEEEDEGVVNEGFVAKKENREVTQDYEGDDERNEGCDDEGCDDKGVEADEDGSESEHDQTEYEPHKDIDDSADIVTSLTPITPTHEELQAIDVATYLHDLEQSIKLPESDPESSVQCHKCQITLLNKTELIEHLKLNSCEKHEPDDLTTIQLPTTCPQENLLPTEESMMSSILAQSESCEGVLWDMAATNAAEESDDDPYGELFLFLQEIQDQSVSLTFLSDLYSHFLVTLCSYF